MKSAQLLVSNQGALSPETLKAFIVELSSWKQKVITKAYSEDYLIGAIYKQNLLFTTEAEYTQLCKCEVELALRCLSEIEREIGGEQNKCASLKNHIVDYIFDLKRYVDQIAKITDPGFVFVEAWKSTTESSIVMFREASNLFWSSTVEKSNPVSHRSAVNLSVFSLRQALEIRFRRAIGIFKILEATGNDAKLRHDFILDFVANNLDLVSIKVGSMCNLAKIYKWTNFSIHMGSMPNIWEVQYAFDFCKKAFQPDAYDSKNGWNINSSIKISNYPELKKRFENAVNSEFQNRSFQFCYEAKPEAVIA